MSRCEHVSPIGRVPVAAMAAFVVLGCACTTISHSGFCDPGNPGAGETVQCTWAGDPPEPGCSIFQPKWEYQKAEIVSCQVAGPGEKGKEECDLTTVNARYRELECDPTSRTCGTRVKGNWINVDPSCTSRMLTGAKCTG